MKPENFVTKYIKNKRIFFTTPSHSGTPVIPGIRRIFGKRYFKFDLSETDGFDNLAAPQGIIKEAMSTFEGEYGYVFSPLENLIEYLRSFSS